MANYRDNSNLSREDIENISSYGTPDDREGSSLITDFPREEATERKQRVDLPKQTSALDQLVKLGILIAGARIAGRAAISEGVGFRSLNALGKLGRFFTQKQYVRHLGGQVTAGELGEVGLITRLGEATGLVKSFGPDVSHFMQSEPGQFYRQEFGRTLGRAPARHSFLTVGDALQRARLITPTQRNILQEAVEFGLVSHETALGKGLLKHSGNVRDVRWATTASGFFSGIKNILGETRIPVVNFRVADIFRSPEAILGKHQGTKLLKAGTRIAGIGELKSGGLLIDDALFAGRGATDFKYVGRGFSHIDLLRHKSVGRVAGTQFGLATDPGTGVQRMLGIGPAYATDRTIVSKVIIDPIRRILRGEVGLKKTVKEADTMSFWQRVLANRELSAEVPNKYKSIADMPRRTRVIDSIRAIFGFGKFTEYKSAATVSGRIPGIKQITGIQPLPGQQHLLYQAKSKWSLLTNWLSSRPAEIMSWTTGIGYRPGKGPWGFLSAGARLFGAYHGIRAAVDYGKYLDYQLEDTIGLSPIKLAAGAYTKARTGQAWLREQLGITSGARWAEDVMPGSMTSGLSGIARTVAPPVAGSLLGGRKGAIAGLAVSALIGYPGIFTPEDILKSGSDLSKEYSGQKKVPVRANRWWEFNATDWTGDKIKYFRPSWYAQLTSDAKYTSVLYGSKKNYWRNVSTTPTPSNLFGIIPQAQPEWLAEQQAERRPYPVTEGSLLKAPKVQATAPGTPSVSSLGMGTLASDVGAVSPYSARQQFSGAFEAITEQFGAYKFLQESILDVRSPFEARTELASSANMSSFHNEFWDMELGGLGGLTEFLRRFIMPRNSIAKQYNPLPNVMPDWLPGFRAQFDEDKRYFLDFHRGDPYRNIPQGEVRLPGQGYESIYRMHSGTPGVYDAYDRYKILADVAPTSRAFRHYRTIVRGWAQAGVLDKSWLEEFEQSEAQVAAQREGGRFTERRFTRVNHDIAELNEAIKYNGFERGIGAAWEYLTHDIVSQVPYMGSKFLRTRSALEAYEENQIYGEEFKNWADPYGSFLAPHFRKAWSKGPVGGALSGSLLGFVGATPPTQLLFAGIGAITGGVGGALTGPGWVPSARKEEWKVQEYFDKLQYVKAKRMQAIAFQRGDSRAIKYWKGIEERTMVGLPRNASLGQIQAAIPANLKPYYRNLTELPVEDRERAMNVLPEYVRPVFSQIWNMGERTQESPDEQVINYFGTRGMPSDTWLGWHPQAPLDVAKIKVVENGATSSASRLHRLGLWESDVLENPLIYRYMETPALRLDSRGEIDYALQQSLSEELANAGLTGLVVNKKQDIDENLTWHITRDKTDKLKDMADYLIRMR